MTPLRELEFLRFAQGLRTQLAAANEVGAAARAALRATRSILGAASASLMILDARGELQIAWCAGPAAPARAPALRAYLQHGEWPRPAADHVIAPLQRRGRRWGLLVAAGTGPFAPGEGQGLVLAADVLAERIQGLDRDRASDVRARIDRKIMTQLRPQDLCYQILHGLRSLTGYDHSGALFVADGNGVRLRLAAEQVAWRKTKSDRIGLCVDLPAEELRALRAAPTCGFDRARGDWRAWQGQASADLARALDGGGDGPGAGSMLLAPLVAGTDFLGVVKLASARAGSLARFEADLLQRFLPQASIAIRNAEKTESLKESVLRAERKHAMADLARGVAHDVNNALGSILPVVQQMRVELHEGNADPEALAEDLRRVEDAVATCRRIFGGMLAFAKGAAGRGAPSGDVRRAVENAASILRATVARRAVGLDLQLPDKLPAVRGAQHELEQLFLNLMTNACDAMPHGGRLRVSAVHRADERAMIAVCVADEGRGMSRGELARAEEAFYSTKAHGTGLGLSICRSIVGEINGRMTIESEPGKGTTVTLLLPVLEARGTEPRR